MMSTLVYKWCGESLKGVDPSTIHRMRSTLVYKGCVVEFEGCKPLNDSPHEVYISLQHVPFEDSLHEVYTTVQRLRFPGRV